MKMLRSGFSVAELMVGVVVTAIVILMVGAIGTIAVQSYNNLRNQSGVYNDAQFALQLVREAVRQSSTTPSIAGSSLTIVTASCPNIHFYIQGASLVYDHNCASSPTVIADPIISNVTGLTFTACNSTSNPCSTPVNGQVIQVALSGTKHGVSFNYTIDATGRNPW